MALAEPEIILKLCPNLHYQTPTLHFTATILSLPPFFFVLFLIENDTSFSVFCQLLLGAHNINGYFFTLLPRDSLWRQKDKRGLVVPALSQSLTAIYQPCGPRSFLSGRHQRPKWQKGKKETTQ